MEATRAATDADLTANLSRLVTEAVGQGTTCLETKTGYGPTVSDEVRSAMAFCVTTAVLQMGSRPGKPCGPRPQAGPALRAVTTPA